MPEYDDYYVAGHSGHRVAQQDYRMKWYTDTFLAKSTGVRILEMGCGAGGIIEYLAKSNECFGVDVSKSGVAIAKSKGLNVQLLDLNLSRLPFHDEYFDFVLCIETIEHLSNPVFVYKKYREC